MRLQKGSPHASFKAEKDAYASLASRDVSIPKVLETGPDYMIFADAGPTLDQLLANRDKDADGCQRALVDAARTLADCHQKAVQHGRPAARDICWDQGHVTFLDWERYRPDRGGPAGFANDFIVFIYDIVRVVGHVPTGLDAARDAYLDAVPDEVRHAITRKTRLLVRIQTVLGPILRRFEHKRDFASIAPTLAFLSGIGA